MSLAIPRQLLIDIMTNQGFKEETKAFDFENLGNTKIQKGFHVEQGTISNVSTNQQTNALENELTVRIWEKASRNQAGSESLQDMLTKITVILNNILDMSNRTDGIKNILLSEVNVVPISDENDNIVRGEITLTATHEICFSL